MTSGAHGTPFVGSVCRGVLLMAAAFAAGRTSWLVGLQVVALGGIPALLAGAVAITTL